MINFFIYIFILFSFLFSQEEIAPGLYENELITFLQGNYTTPSTESYSSARNILYGIIDNNNGYISCIYTNYAAYLPPNSGEGNATGILYDQGINCEHLWPQSLGAGSGNAQKDMHHLRPCKDNVNTSRGNKPFGDILDFQTNTWYWLEYSTSNIPQNNINEYSESGTNTFEPREDVKGDVARSMFYFYTIYNNVADDNFFNSQKETLYEWHNNDPATNEEINRTWEIASYQNNIPNPFVLDNTLIFRTYFYEPPDILTGDVTGDGTVNIVDVVLIVNFILETQSLNNEQQEIADVNIDGVVNIVDIIYLVNLITGE